MSGMIASGMVLFMMLGCAANQSRRLGFPRKHSDRIPGYENVVWGMSYREVAAQRPKAVRWTESASHPIGNGLEEKRIVAYSAATVYYWVGAKGLDMIMIVFTNKEKGRGAYPDFYRSIKNLLRKEYGLPRSDSSRIADMGSSPGKDAFDYQFPTSWTLGETRIELTCAGGCSGIDLNNTVAIKYTNTRLHRQPGQTF